jgi:hypothetical protein
MRRPLAAASAALLALILAVPTVVATSPDTPRADGYYDIWCTTAEGETYLAKQVDARAIQPEKDPGGKDTATEQFNANNPFGETCAAGPLQGS